MAIFSNTAFTTQRPGLPANAARSANIEPLQSPVSSTSTQSNDVRKFANIAAPQPGESAPAQGSMLQNLLGNGAVTPSFSRDVTTLADPTRSVNEQRLPPGTAQTDRTYEFQRPSSTGEQGAPPEQDPMDRLQELTEQMMANFDAQAQQRMDAVQAGTLANMRQAAGMAGLAGGSFGGSFADAQRQAILGGQAQQGAIQTDLQAQQNQLLAQMFGAQFDDYSRERNFDFEREVRQDTWDRADQAAAGEVIGDWRANNGGREPGYNIRGQKVGWENVPQEERDVIAAQAASEGYDDPEQWYNEQPNYQQNEDAGQTEVERKQQFLGGELDQYNIPGLTPVDIVYDENGRPQYYVYENSQGDILSYTYQQVKNAKENRS